MVLDQWVTGDTIAAIQINNRGLRSGSTTDLDTGIPIGSRTVGNLFYNSTTLSPQVLVVNTGNGLRGNLKILLGADSNEVTVASATPTLVKDLDVIFCDSSGPGFSGQQITVVAMLKCPTAGTATLRLRVDGGGDETPTTGTLVLTSTSYTRVQAVFDVSAKARTSTDCVRSLNFYLDASANTAFLKQLEVYGL